MIIINDIMFFYIMINEDWKQLGVVKYGVTDNPRERIQKIDQHPEKNEYLYLYKCHKMESYKYYKEPDKIISTVCRDIEKTKRWVKRHNLEHLDKIVDFIVNGSGGREFIYEAGIIYLQSIILKDFKKLGIEVEECSFEEVKEINDSTNSNTDDYDVMSSDDDEIIEDIPSFQIRPYQIEIIDYVTNAFKSGSNRLYLELATGAGKTTITHEIVKVIKPRVLINLSPRINIKEQNKNKMKFHDITVLNYCTQSFKEVYKIILKIFDKYGLVDIFIWFDEAHWGLEGWCDSVDEEKTFLLRDSRIKYRFFTSASPNKDVIIHNKSIFGELYSPMKMSELIEQGYLCKINVELFDFQLSRKNMTANDYVLFMIQTFNKFNKHQGFSFHNCCDSAYELYKYNLKLFQDGKTDIKPYLLINDEECLKRKIIFNDIKRFEKENKALGYVVGRYTMGYDNPKLDILFFSDPKTSFKENNQSIGRGTRINGDKKLHVIIPTNHNYDIDDDYSNLRGTLEYLIRDVELNIDNITINISNKKKFAEDEFIEDFDFKCNSESTTNIGTILYDITKKEIRWTKKKFTTQLMRNNIHNHSEYCNYYKNKKQIANLPEPTEIFKIKDFRYLDTYREGECPYYIDKKDYLKIVEKFSEELFDLFDDVEKIDLLLSNDPKIPKENPWLFYGGKREDYFSI